MFSMKKEKIARKSPKKNISFYISLALCIAAVAGAESQHQDHEKASDHQFRFHVSFPFFGCHEWFLHEFVSVGDCRFVA